MNHTDQTDGIDERECPRCGKPMTFTGLPDVAGPVSARFYRCETCGVIKVPVDEQGEGWG